MNKTAYRWHKGNIDPETVYRCLRMAGAVKSWENPHRTLYQLGHCRVECRDSRPHTLLIHGPTEEAVRNAARRLLYPDTDGIVTPITPEDDHP